MTNRPKLHRARLRNSAHSIPAQLTANRGPADGVYRKWYNSTMKNLYRSSDEKVVAGVCAGLAHILDLNATGVRWAVALVTLFLTGVPAIVYVVLWAILEERPTGGVVDV